MNNGNGVQPQQVQVNPVECARYALVLLSRATFNGQERPMYDLAESLLRAIAEGRVTCAPVQAPEPIPAPPPQPEALQ